MSVRSGSVADSNSSLELVCFVVKIGQRIQGEPKPLFHHRDDGPIATMARRVVAAELRRIKSRRRASVEKEGVAAAEAIAEETGEVVKVDPSFGDDEMHLTGTRHADPVPRLAIGGIHDEGRMDGAGDDEHRSRLRGKIRLSKLVPNFAHQVKIAMSPLGNDAQCKCDVDLGAWEGI
jgi:hypothetical protein